MLESSFVRYAGDTDFHDGCILGVEQRNDSVHVRVRGCGGKVFVVDFTKVGSLTANRPDGMLLCALGEFTARPPLRRFVFANWDDESDSVLEVVAETIEVRPE